MAEDSIERQSVGSPPGFLTLCARPDVVRRAIRVALLVGTILATINHGDILFGGPITPVRVVRIGLTYCVPYVVATYASVQAIRGEKRGG